MNGFEFLIDKVRRFKVKSEKKLERSYSNLNFVFKKTKEIKHIQSYFLNVSRGLHVTNITMSPTSL